MADGLEPPGGAEAVYKTKGIACVDDLAPAVQAPQAVVSIWIAHRHITARLEAVRDAAAVLSVLEIVDK
jgi:hypothetical protein